MKNIFDRSSLKNCGGCISWRTDQATTDKELKVLVCPCSIKQQPTRGSDSCADWFRRPGGVRL